MMHEHSTAIKKTGSTNGCGYTTVHHQNAKRRLFMWAIKQCMHSIFVENHACLNGVACIIACRIHRPI